MVENYLLFSQVKFFALNSAEVSEVLRLAVFLLPYLRRHVCTGQARPWMEAAKGD